MLNNKGFDLWADDYDKSVGVSDEDRTYPFAGYKDILNKICSNVLAQSGKWCWILVLVLEYLRPNSMKMDATSMDKIFQTK